MRRRAYRVIAGGVFALAVSTAAHLQPTFAAEEVPAWLAALPAEVEDVRIAGTWTEGDRSGSYRTVITRTAGASVTARLFIQWLAYDDKGAGKVDRTIEIPELAELKVDISNVNAETRDDGLSLFIDTISPEGEQLYELIIRSPDDYRFGPASN